MMVWVVIERMHDSQPIVGVYSTRTDAEAVRDRLNVSARDEWDRDYGVEEWLVQPAGERRSSLD